MQKEHFEFLKLIRKWRISLLLSFLMAGILSGFFLRGTILMHQSQVTFYITGEKLISPITNGHSGLSPHTLVSFDQILVEQSTYSTEMMKHLIDTFNLYQRYHVDTTQQYYFEHTVNRIRKRIKFKKLTPDLASITVRDPDNEMAAAMANDIVQQLNRMKNEYINRKLGSSMKIYDAFVEKSRSQIHEQNIKLLQLIAGLREHFPMGKSGAGDQMTIAELESTIYETIRVNGATLDNFIRSQANLSEIRIMLKEDAPVSIVTLKRAIPETQSRMILLFLAAVGIGSGFVLLLLVIAYYFYFSLREEINVLTGRAE